MEVKPLAYHFDLRAKLWYWLYLPETVLNDEEASDGACSIAQLPFEVLEQIFLAYYASSIVCTVTAPEFPDQQLPISPKSKLECHFGRIMAAPITLGGVCREWRAVTLATSALWSHLCLVRPASMEDLDFFHLWLRRSGSYVPLDISLKEFSRLPGSRHFPDYLLQSILDIIISQSHRWRHIRLCLKDSTEHFLHELHPSLHSLTSLETLHFDFTPTWTIPQVERLSRSLYSAPNLVSLRYDGPLLSDLRDFDAPWEQITTIEFKTRIRWDVLVGVLSRSKQLRSLTVDHIAFDAFFHAEVGSLHLPFLQTLILGPHLLLPVEFFGSLDSPNLQELGLTKTFGYQFDDAFTAISELVQRTQCQLRSLTWFEPSGNVGLPPRDFIIRSLIPTTADFLQHLVHLIIVSPTTDEHLNALAHLDDDHCPLPHLETLILEQCWSTDGALSSMLVSRALSKFDMKLTYVRAVLFGTGMIVNPRFTTDLSLRLTGIQLDVSKGL
ncbi:hypothetical protein FA15DRAFT_669356 [Coprinopsis marcescibilis]|uniref:F-box domain-containing protein n=1 Tax=Coprinopsis marcescibilis TaxID=230819 RepID=A0A5C3KXR0_COPMA|nr:hypothetical protein FA15DRAFT_669356 [Coprinopsis marcescibilis]